MQCLAKTPGRSSRRARASCSELLDACGHSALDRARDAEALVGAPPAALVVAAIVRADADAHAAGRAQDVSPRATRALTRLAMIGRRRSCSRIRSRRRPFRDAAFLQRVAGRRRCRRWCIATVVCRRRRGAGLRAAARAVRSAARRAGRLLLSGDRRTSSSGGSPAAILGAPSHLPARRRLRRAAALGVLVARERAVRSARREGELRAHRRGGHARRPGRRPGGRADSRADGQPRSPLLMLADAARDLRGRASLRVGRASRDVSRGAARAGGDVAACSVRRRCAPRRTSAPSPRWSCSAPPARLSWTTC